MSLPKFADVRQSRRRRVKNLPGRLHHYESSRTLAHIPVDISSVGIGILTNEQIGVGTIFNLLLDSGESILLEVKWRLPEWNVADLCGEDLLGSKIFRCGLQTVDPNLDLESLFIKLNCVT